MVRKIKLNLTDEEKKEFIKLYNKVTITLSSKKRNLPSRRNTSLSLSSLK